MFIILDSTIPSQARAAEDFLSRIAKQAPRTDEQRQADQEVHARMMRTLERVRAESAVQAGPTATQLANQEAARAGRLASLAITGPVRI